MSTPFASHIEYLWAELGRVEHLVRARFALWCQIQSASDKPREHWGLVHISESEVQTYLAAGFSPPDRGLAAAEHLVAEHHLHYRRDIEANSKRAASTADLPSFPLVHLRAEFELDELDVDLLLLAVLPEVDSRYRLLYGYLQNDASRELPTADLLSELVAPVAPDPGATASRLAPGGRLRSDLLIHVDEPYRGSFPIGRRQIAADERVVRFLLGDITPGGGPLRSVVEVEQLDATHLVGPADRLERLRALGAWCRSQAATNGVFVLLYGAPGAGRRTTARALATLAGKRLLAVDVAALQRQSSEWRAAIELAYREARLRGAAILWTDAGSLLPDGNPQAEWHELLEVADHAGVLTFVTSAEAWEPLSNQTRTTFLRLAIPEPDLRTRVHLWLRYLPRAEDLDLDVDRGALAETLAGAFQLTPGQIITAVAAARATTLVRHPEGRPTADDLTDACRRQSGRRLTRLAQRVEPRPGLKLEQLVLAPPSQRQLEELHQRITLRARLAEHGPQPGAQGLLAMFTGSSGTGKTMAAELLAQEQGVDLYKVDLAEVVSKYVGDTEKNLRRVFDEAEDSNAILFFDEADALFGKRGEVREARDRWANIEINFLLQRVELFAGVVILATNLRQNIDEAFMRRIHVIVEFPFPDTEARYRIWKTTLPPREHMESPPDDQIQDLAARFRIPGGSIRNVIEDARFRALAAPDKSLGITREHLTAALAREYQKLGRPVTVVEFGEDLYPTVETQILMIPAHQDLSGPEQTTV